MSSGRRRTIKIKSDFSKLLNENYSYNSVGARSDYNSKHVASTRHLTRIIMSLMELHPYMIQSEFVNNISIPSYKVKDALNWLVNNKILIKEICQQKGRKHPTTYIYSINPKWKALKEEDKNVK